MKTKQHRLPYIAEIRNQHFGIRRGIPYDKHGKATGEHQSEVHSGKQKRYRQPNLSGDARDEQ